MKRIAMIAAIFVAMAAPGLAFAGGKSMPGMVAGQSTQTMRLTPKQRGDIARTLVRMWAADVREQGGNVRDWAMKLGRFVGTADAANLRQALDMPTYQTMMGVLQGQPVASKSVQQALAQAADVGIESLGSTIADTTYTPLPNGRCRVADSRVIASPMPGGVERDIDVEEATTYASQGGNGTFANGDGAANCGIPSLTTAVALSVTVLSTGSEGFFKVFENNKPFQTGSTVYYTGAVSASNDMIVTSCQSCASELSLYSSSAVHYVVDVVGYFIPNQATALQCENTAFTQSVSAGSNFDIPIPGCPAGYTITGAGCATGGFNQADWAVTGLDRVSSTQMLAFCSGTNKTAGTITVRGTAQCCRVPGR